MKNLILVRTNKGVLEAELLRETATTVHVRLPDGHVIKRKKSRDLPTWSPPAKP